MQDKTRLDTLGLLTEAELADALGICKRTVTRWRELRKGPPFTKLGRLIFYRQESVDAWVAAHESKQPRAESSRGGAGR